MAASSRMIAHRVGLLAAEAQLAQDSPDVSGMITMDGALFDQRGDAGQLPHCGRMALRLRTLDHCSCNLDWRRSVCTWVQPHYGCAARQGRPPATSAAGGVCGLPLHLKQPRHFSRGFTLREKFHRLYTPCFHRAVITLFRDAAPEPMADYYAKQTRRRSCNSPLGGYLLP
ncbi:MAG: hypothetical protein PHQ04_05005 [Opitutaceae bacterium]|nr:hypothetical protein [Opitutaceae bacterium]